MCIGLSVAASGKCSALHSVLWRHPRRADGAPPAAGNHQGVTPMSRGRCPEPARRSSPTLWQGACGSAPLGSRGQSNTAFADLATASILCRARPMKASRTVGKIARHPPLVPLLHQGVVPGYVGGAISYTATSPGAVAQDVRGPPRARAPSAPPSRNPPAPSTDPGEPGATPDSLKPPMWRNW
jgi:hypothetical protein